MARLRTVWPYLAIGAIAIGFGNFFWLIIESQSLGGDALGGYARDGHYFVGSHGTYTEVARDVWEWSRVHAQSLFVTHPLALVCMASLILQKAFGDVPGMATEVRSQRQAAIAGSGPRLAYKRCAAHLGEVRLNGPFVGVSVFPAGILLKPILSRPRAILATEIRAADAHHHPFAGSVEIVHVSPECASPVELFVDPAGELSAAIEQVFVNRAEWSTHVPAGPGEPAASGPHRPATPRMVEVATGVIGVGVFAALFYIGVTWVIPGFGAFGLIWFAGLIGIALVNLRTYLRRRGSGR